MVVLLISVSMPCMMQVLNNHHNKVGRLVSAEVHALQDVETRQPGTKD